MATSEQIRNRIVELIKNKQFSKSDYMQIISQLVHEGIIDNRSIIEIVKYLVEEILNAQTRISYSEYHKKCDNSHQFAKCERFKLKNIEFIVDNE